MGIREPRFSCFNSGGLAAKMPTAVTNAVDGELREGCRAIPDNGLVYVRIRLSYCSIVLKAGCTAKYSETVYCLLKDSLCSRLAASPYPHGEIPCQSVPLPRLPKCQAS